MQKAMINEKLVRVIRKNANEQIRVMVGRFGDYKVATLRIWFNDQGTFRPTQKGFAFRMETLDEIISALGEAREIDVPDLPE